MAAPLFASSQLYARELAAAEVPRLQALFDANPEYFQTINGRPPYPNEAQTEFNDRPPASMPYDKQWVIGLYSHGDDALQGLAMVTSNLLAPGLWHGGLYLIASALHGSGAAFSTFAALEEWVRENGAGWLRLGVVIGNAKGQRFWAKCGFQQVRTRAGVDTGGKLNDLAVLVKPLRGGSLADYLALVPRDRPESELP